MNTIEGYTTRTTFTSSLTLTFILAPCRTLASSRPYTINNGMWLLLKSVILGKRRARG